MKPNRIFLRGDTHGDFYSWLPQWCEGEETTINDVLIILGDSGLRFEGAARAREQNRKEFVAKYPITIFAVRGNHDRPFTPELCSDVELTACSFIDGANNLMWHDKAYPNIWYFNELDPIFYICGQSFLILPGAYSIDKDWRKIMHWTWYEDEQLSHEQQLDYLDQIHDKMFDHVLSHTCPIEWQPIDLFMRSIDQSRVDSSTEEWLSDVLKYIGYKHWWFGHYHANREYGFVGNYDDIQGETTMLYDKIVRII